MGLGPAGGYLMGSIHNISCEGESLGREHVFLAPLIQSEPSVSTCISIDFWKRTKRPAHQAREQEFGKEDQPTEMSKTTEDELFSMRIGGERPTAGQYMVVSVLMP